jgi:hypothetical protein
VAESRRKRPRLPRQNRKGEVLPIGQQAGNSPGGSADGGQHEPPQAHPGQPDQQAQHDHRQPRHKQNHRAEPARHLLEASEDLNHDLTGPKGTILTDTAHNSACFSFIGPWKRFSLEDDPARQQIRNPKQLQNSTHETLAPAPDPFWISDFDHSGLFRISSFSPLGDGGFRGRHWPADMGLGCQQ